MPTFANSLFMDLICPAIASTLSALFMAELQDCKAMEMSSSLPASSPCKKTSSSEKASAYIPETRWPNESVEDGGAGLIIVFGLELNVILRLLAPGDVDRGLAERFIDEDAADDEEDDEDDVDAAKAGRKRC